jgi:hypothetical protein
MARRACRDAHAETRMPRRAYRDAHAEMCMPRHAGGDMHAELYMRADGHHIGHEGPSHCTGLNFLGERGLLGELTEGVV